MRQNAVRIKIQLMPASLYGLTHSNRNFADAYYWGKNQFNSAFPAALACYMRDKGTPANYLSLRADRTVTVSNLSFSEIFGTALPNNQLEFAFETTYNPYAAFVQDQLTTIDLVIKDLQGNFLRALEVKLTTLPDNSTANLAEERYGCELVIRSATLKYMALSVAQSCNTPQDKARIGELFDFCGTVRDWPNRVEARGVLQRVIAALETFFVEFADRQKPLLLQPVWKTVGKTPILADNCLDIFVWSDFALSRLFMDSARENAGDRITRQQRAALRFARFIYEGSRQDRVYQAPIFDGMTYDAQNDKEFSITGFKTNPYMRCPRLTNLAISKQEIRNIVLGGGQNHLSPERRFDAIIYFSTDLFVD